MRGRAPTSAIECTAAHLLALQQARQRVCPHYKSRSTAPAYATESVAERLPSLLSARQSAYQHYKLHGSAPASTAQCMANWQGASQHHRVRGRAQVSAIEVSTVRPPAPQNARQCACQTPQNTAVHLPMPSCVRRRAYPFAAPPSSTKCVAMHRLASQNAQ